MKQKQPRFSKLKAHMREHLIDGVDIQFSSVLLANLRDMFYLGLHSFITRRLLMTGFVNGSSPLLKSIRRGYIRLKARGL